MSVLLTQTCCSQEIRKKSRFNCSCVVCCQGVIWSLCNSEGLLVIKDSMLYAVDIIERSISVWWDIAGL